MADEKEKAVRNDRETVLVAEGKKKDEVSPEELDKVCGGAGTYSITTGVNS